MLRCYDGFVVNNNKILHYVVLCYIFITDKEVNTYTTITTTNDAAKMKNAVVNYWNNVVQTFKKLYPSLSRMIM